MLYILSLTHITFDTSAPDDILKTLRECKHCSPNGYKVECEGKQPQRTNERRGQIEHLVFVIKMFSALYVNLLVAGQKPATSIFNRFSEMTWEGGLLLERNTFRYLEHITIVFV